MKQSEINIFYSHELYANLNGKEFCECEECTEIRPKIYAILWREANSKQSKQCKYLFYIGHEGNPTSCCEKKGVINCNCITCKEEEC